MRQIARLNWANLLTFRFWIAALGLTLAIEYLLVRHIPEIGEQLARWSFWPMVALLGLTSVLFGTKLTCPHCGKGVKAGRTTCHHCGKETIL